MKNPFVYGKEVSGENFCNRKNEIKELSRDIENSQNVMVFSPRRFGKTSLIKEVLRKARNKGIITIYADLYSVLSEEDFVKIYADAIANSIFGNIRKKMRTIAGFFKNIRPQVGFDERGQPSLSLDIDKNEIIPSTKDALGSLSRYVESKGKRAAVVCDEFQQLDQLENDRIIKIIRTSIQSHNNISYIFMGSKKHLILDMFNNPNNPFYRSAKSFPLNKISDKDLEEFIKKRFESSGKTISDELTKEIVSICDSHPYYMQYFCHIIWEMIFDKKNVDKNILDKSLELLLKRESPTYEATMDLLTRKQKKALVALSLAGKDEKVYSSEFLNRFNLGSASSFQRVMQSLISKDLITKESGSYFIVDVFFKKWLSALYSDPGK